MARQPSGIRGSWRILRKSLALRDSSKNSGEESKLEGRSPVDRDAGCLPEFAIAAGCCSRVGDGGFQ